MEDLIDNPISFYAVNGSISGLSHRNGPPQARALRQASRKLGVSGVATAPLLIAVLSQTDVEHVLWREEVIDTYTEVVTGIDTEGRLGYAGQPVLVVVHGGGILTPKRIREAYKTGSVDPVSGAALYSKGEFNRVLEGRLPFGEIPTYTADEVRQGIIPDIFDSYAVCMDGRHVQEQSLGRCYRGEFMDNDLVVAIAGTLEYLTPFFDRIASDLEASPDFPSYKTVDFSRPQGHIQRLYTNTDIPFNALLDDYPDGGFHGFDDHIGTFFSSRRELPQTSRWFDREYFTDLSAEYYPHS